MEEDILKNIERKFIDIKKYRKSIRKKFNHYFLILRFGINKEYAKKYKESSNKVLEVLFRSLEKDSTFETKNFYFLLAIMDSHFEFFYNMKQRMKTIGNHKELLKLAYESILTKNKELFDVLINNENEPITGEQMEQVLKEKSNDK